MDSAAHGLADERQGPAAPHRWHSPGLRFKFNAVVLPVLALTIVSIGWLDYRHEVGAVMAAHELHSGPVSSAVGAGPIDPTTSPEAVGHQTLVTHAVYGALTLMVVMAAINGVLSAFVLRPIARIREGFRQMERGHWRTPSVNAPRDEVGQLTDDFQRLGLTLDAFVGQLLRAERLATLALLARRTAAKVEPEVQQIGLAVGRLHGLPDAEVRRQAESIAGSTAQLLAAVRDLDRLFEAGRKLAGSDAATGGATVRSAHSH